MKNMYIITEKDRLFLIRLENKLGALEDWSKDVNTLWELNEKLIQQRSTYKKDEMGGYQPTKSNLSCEECLGHDVCLTKHLHGGGVCDNFSPIPPKSGSNISQR